MPKIYHPVEYQKNKLKPILNEVNKISLSLYSAKKEFKQYLSDNPEHIVVNFHTNHVSAFCQHCFQQEVFIEGINKESILNCIGCFINEHADHQEVEDMDDISENITFEGDDFGVFKSSGNKDFNYKITENIIPFKKKSF